MMTAITSSKSHNPQPTWKEEAQLRITMQVSQTSLVSQSQDSMNQQTLKCIKVESILTKRKRKKVHYSPVYSMMTNRNPKKIIMLEVQLSSIQTVMTMKSIPISYSMLIRSSTDWSREGLTVWSCQFLIIYILQMIINSRRGNTSLSCDSFVICPL